MSIQSTIQTGKPAPLQSVRKTQVIYGAPYQFTINGKPVIYVNEFHHVYDGNKVVDAYKYANLPFASRGDANRFIFNNGRKTL